LYLAKVLTSSFDRLSLEIIIFIEQLEIQLINNSLSFNVYNF